MARVVRATLQAHLCLVSQSARGRLPKKSTHFSADTKIHFYDWSRRETYTPLERSKRRPVPSELQACAHLRSQPPCAPNCTAPQLPPTSSASHPPCLPSPCTSPLHLTPPWPLAPVQDVACAALRRTRAVPWARALQRACGAPWARSAPRLRQLQSACKRTPHHGRRACTRTWSAAAS